MLLDPERFLGWDISTYLIMIAIAVIAFIVGFRQKKRKWTNLCVILMFAVLTVLCEVILSLSLGGTGLFFLEWLAYFGELLFVLPVFAGYLLGALTRFITAKSQLCHSTEPNNEVLK